MDSSRPRGTYYFVVSTSSRAADAGGTYSISIHSDLSLEDKHSDIYYSATNIGFDNPLSGAISPAEDLDYFTFPAVLNQDYTIQATLGTAEAVNISVISYRHWRWGIKLRRRHHPALDRAGHGQLPDCGYGR